MKLNFTIFFSTLKLIKELLQNWRPLSRQKNQILLYFHLLIPWNQLICKKFNFANIDEANINVVNINEANIISQIIILYFIKKFIMKLKFTITGSPHLKMIFIFFKRPCKVKFCKVKLKVTFLWIVNSYPHQIVMKVIKSYFHHIVMKVTKVTPITLWWK